MLGIFKGAKRVIDFGEIVSFLIRGGGVFCLFLILS